MILSSSPVRCGHHYDHHTYSLWFYILHKTLSCHLFGVLFKQSYRHVGKHMAVSVIFTMSHELRVVGRILR